jgi:hypothetical protein
MAAKSQDALRERLTSNSHAIALIDELLRQRRRQLAHEREAALEALKLSRRQLLERFCEFRHGNLSH